VTIASIRQAIEGVSNYFAQNPDAARSTDASAVAVIEEGLRCRAEGPHGAVLVSDMPKGAGGGGSAPTPGWFMRAALANCDATVIAMRAAQLGVALSKLEVTVSSQSDDRGLFGVGDNIPPGPLSLQVHVRIGAPGTTPEQLREIVEWAEAHSPVGDAMRRAIPCTMEIDAG
jgi:uncharacterized OsmC-like protein